MSNINHNFSLAVTDASFAFQELKINLDGSTPPPGQKKLLYYLPNAVIIHNDSDYNLLVKWATEDEGDADAGDWSGAWLVKARDMKIIRNALNESLLYKIGVKLNESGSANIKISGLDYRSVFDDS